MPISLICWRVRGWYNHLLQARELYGFVQGTAHAAHGICEGREGHEHCWCLLERRRKEQTVDPRIRHHVSERSKS